MPTEISQSQADKSSVIYLCEVPGGVRFKRQKVGLWLPEAEGRRPRRRKQNLSFDKMETVLEMDGGDGCIMI